MYYELFFHNIGCKIVFIFIYFKCEFITKKLYANTDFYDFYKFGQNYNLKQL